MNQKKFAGAFAAFTLSILAASSALCSSAPVAFYPAQGNGNDISGSGHNATVPVLDASNPGISYTTGKMGQAFRFDPSSGTYVDFGNWFDFQSFTLAMWVRDDATDAAPESDFVPIVQYLSNADFLWSLTYSASDNAYVWANDGAGTITFSLTRGVWHYLVVARDGATGVTNIYVDGASVGTTGAAPWTLNYDFASKIRMGASADLQNHWHGAVDEFRIYNRAISADEVALLSSNAVVDLVVPGAANPYLAGNTTAGCGDSTANGQGAAQVNGLNLPGGATISFAAAGSVNYGGGTPTDPADGVSSWTKNPENGIAGAVYPLNTLVGVFLDDTDPNSTAVPDALNFSDSGNVNGGTNYTTLSPALKQVFFIGDGSTSTGAVQQIVVPTGTTRLFLGTTDGCGWAGNSGSFSVRVKSSAGTVAPPAATLSFSATGPTTDGGAIHFTATGPSGRNVRVQTTTTPDDEASWTDLNDGNGGAMTEDGTTGNYAVDSTAYPGGDAIYFRAIAAKDGETDLISPSLGPLSLKQAAMSIIARMTSTSDPAKGLFTHIGDDLTFKLTFRNNGNAPAKNLKVVAKVPTYLHSDHQLHIATDNGNSIVSTVSGDTTAQLGLGATFNGGTFHGAVPIASSTRVTAIIDNTHFQISSPATASTTGVINVVYGAAAFQFSAADVMMSPGSTFVPESAPGAKDAHIVWDVGNLDPDFQQFVTFTIHIANKVRIQQQVTLPNDYAVYSTTSQPAGSITGYGSGAPDVETQIEGPISFFAKANSTSVAPGAQFSYTLTLKNLGTTTVNHPAAMFTQPEFARFVTAAFSYNPAKKKPKKGAAPFAGAAKLVYVQGQSDPQVVMDVGSLSPNQVATITLTFQAQWAEPSDVPKLSTIDYAAAFLTEAAYNAFKSSYDSAKSDPNAPVTTDFLAYLNTNSNNVAFARNDSGIVDLPLQGSTADAPQLALAKTVSDTVSRIELNDDHVVNMVKPGEQISFLLVALNNGNSDAGDVYVQDRMPDHATFVSAVQVYPTPAPVIKKVGKKKKTVPGPPVVLHPVLDADGHHLRFTGLKLGAHKKLAFTYTVQVDSGSNAPATGTIIGADDANTPVSVSSIGSSLTPHTPAGIYGGGAIVVVGDTKFAQPSVRALVPTPRVTSDASATANTLNSIYAGNANAFPLTSPMNFTSWVPGVERYYIHYQNLSTVAVNNVTLTVPVPQHTVFYRAAFVSLPPTNASGQLGKFNCQIINPPAGATITAPAQLADDKSDVLFNFNQLPAGTKGEGDVIVEVIVTGSAVDSNGSYVGGDGDRAVELADSFRPDDSFVAFPRLSVLGVNTFNNTAMRVGDPGPKHALDPNNVPNYGLSVNAPREVKNGDVFSVVLTVFNLGDRANEAGNVDLTVPPGVELVSINAGQGNAQVGQDSDGHIIASGTLATDNGPVGVDNFDTAMQPHTAAALTIKLRATAAPGSDILISDMTVTEAYMGAIFAPPISIHVYYPGLVSRNQGPNPGSITTITGVPLTQFSFRSGDVNIIDIGKGNIVASGGGNLITNDGGSLITNDGGSIVASGGGNLIHIGLTDGATLLANRDAIVASGAGNIVVPPGATGIVASGGGNIVASGGGNIIGPDGASIVATGGGNVIPRGAGIIPPALSGLFGSGPNSLITNDGGSIVATGGGNIVATGGGNIVAVGGGNIVATGGGNLLGSLPGTAGVITSASGNIVASGAGNIVSTNGGAIASP